MRLIFMGRRPHGCEALRWLVEQGHEVVAVVAPSGYGQEMPYWSPTVRETAQQLGLRVCDFSEFKRQLPHAQEVFGEVDLIISFLFWKKISPAVAQLGRYGCINFHPAPLPDYKGLGGYNFAILDKVGEWGATAHYVDDDFDTGPIIAVRRFRFDWRRSTALSLERQTRPVIVNLFKDVIARVDEHGWLEATENVGGRYISRLDMENSKRVDLQRMSADEIDLRARAFWFPPFDGAYIEKDGERFTLVSSSVLSELESLHRK